MKQKILLLLALLCAMMLGAQAQTDITLADEDKLIIDDTDPTPDDSFWGR